MRVTLTTLLMMLSLSVGARLSAQGVDALREEASKLTKQDIPDLVRKAEAGEVKAQVLLGEAYSFGYGVRRKDSEAVKWHRKAAEQGNAVAQYELSILYQEGHGVHRDEGEAVKWCGKAAEQGLIDAQANLGAFYHVKENYSQAEMWTRKAADGGDFLARENLSLWYAQGAGLPQDYPNAYMWILLARAARCGQPPQVCVERDPEDDATTRKLQADEGAKLSAGQIAEARRRASDWLVAHQKEPLPAADTESQRANFLVSHEHSGAGFLPGNPGLRPDYCFGWLTIGTGVIRYSSLRGNDTWEYTFAQVKQLKKSPGAVRMQVETGKKYTLSVINDRFEVQGPDALFDALNKAVGRN